MLVGSIQQAAPRGGQRGIVPEIDFKTLVCIYPRLYIMGFKLSM